MPVRITDINYGNHLANTAVPGMLHETRIRWLKSLGYHSEAEIEGCGLIQLDMAISFLAEAFHGDELTVHLGINDVTGTSFDLYYRISNGTCDIATAKTTMTCFDYKKRRVAKIPATFRSMLEFQEQ